MRDFRKIQSDPPAGVNAAPLEDNIMIWQAVILGCAAARVICQREWGSLSVHLRCAAQAG
jgi:hypothetical protein